MKRNIWALMAMVCCLTLLLGCARRNRVKASQHEERKVEVRKEKVDEQTRLELPEQPLLSIEGEKESYESFTRPARRFDLSLKKADLTEVLFSMAEQSNYQLVMDPGIKGVIDLDMRDVTVYEVIAEVCRTHDLNCSIDGDMVRVQKKRMETKLFYLDYVITARKGSGTLTASTATTAGDISGDSSSSVSASASSGGGSGTEENESTNTISTEENMDIWGTIKEQLSTLLSGEKAKLSVNPESGMVAVTDFPENMELIGRYLGSLERRLKGQVLIEAKIMEVLLNDKNQYGIDWSAIVNFPGNIKGNLAGGNTLIQNLATGSTGFQFGVSNNKVSFLLDAIAEQGNLNVLSNPRVSALNNQKAIIRVGTQDVFFQAVVTPATATTAPITSFSPQTITIGVVLSVTPQIGRDGKITLAIHPSISTKSGEAEAPDGNTAPIIEIRETNTVITVDDGETVLIGGLMQDNTQETVKSVPFLGDIPFLGALFRSTEQEKRKGEVVILLTPRVVRSENMKTAVLEEGRLFRENLRGFHLGARPWLYGTEGEKKLVW